MQKSSIKSISKDCQNKINLSLIGYCPARYSHLRRPEAKGFGSVARNEQTEASDIDILIEFSWPVGFFALLEPGDYLPVHLGAQLTW